MGSELGPKTEAVITRDGHFIRVEWQRMGKELSARLYEPQGMMLSPALADLLVIAMEEADPLKHRSAREIWTVWTNTDLTEGRGTEHAKHHCELGSTALRLAKGGYVQGGDCRVTRERMFYLEGKWYAPGPYVTQPSDADRREEERLREARLREERREQAIQRAKELGLSAEDIAALRGD